MPVTFTIAPHPASQHKIRGHGEKLDATGILKEACYPQWEHCGELLQSSVEGTSSSLVPNSNGFVHAVLQAYGSHRHLHLRPDDVWLAILTQLSFYINAHAEDLRSYFVAHGEKKRLAVSAIGDRYSVDYAALAREFADRIHESVVDATLVEWILPDFTTTTLKDMTICSMIAMASLKEYSTYFEYYDNITCGIPSVTLEGEKSDWEEIYPRLYRLYDLGDEPSHDLEFWNHVAYSFSEGCGLDDLSGWITGFCVWSNKGIWMPKIMPEAIPVKPLVPQAKPRPRANVFSNDISNPAAGPAPDLGCLTLAQQRLARLLPRSLRRLVMRDGDGSKKVGRTKAPTFFTKAKKLNEATKDKADADKNAVDESTSQVQKKGSVLDRVPYKYCKYTLDDIPYFIIPLDELPAGYSEVDITINDNGAEVKCLMVAGHVAFSVTSNTAGGLPDAVQPSPEWFISEKKPSQ